MNYISICMYTFAVMKVCICYATVSLQFYLDYTERQRKLYIYSCPMRSGWEKWGFYPGEEEAKGRPYHSLQLPERRL